MQNLAEWQLHELQVLPSEHVRGQRIQDLILLWSSVGSTEREQTEALRASEERTPRTEDIVVVVSLDMVAQKRIETDLRESEERKLADVASHTIETCRSIARGVSPLTESRGSIVQSLRQIADLAATGGHASVNFEAIENAPLTLPYESLDQLHRIAQEAVNNALRHSDAANIEITIQVDPTLVRIKVVDNGRGLGSFGEAQAGLGIDGMRQRAATIGARLWGGAAVVCECPQRAPSEAPAKTLWNE